MVECDQELEGYLVDEHICFRVGICIKPKPLHNSIPLWALLLVLCNVLENVVENVEGNVFWERHSIIVASDEAEKVDAHRLLSTPLKFSLWFMVSLVIAHGTNGMQ